jgi:uncharacterized glyoxalase superfamily protein PhnB
LTFSLCSKKGDLPKVERKLWTATPKKR